MTWQWLQFRDGLRFETKKLLKRSQSQDFMCAGNRPVNTSVPSYWSGIHQCHLLYFRTPKGRFTKTQYLRKKKKRKKEKKLTSRCLLVLYTSINASCVPCLLYQIIKGCVTGNIQVRIFWTTNKFCTLLGTTKNGSWIHKIHTLLAFFGSNPNRIC